MTLQERLKETIRDVNDFPKPGILFKDISTLILDASLSNDILDHLVEMYQHSEIDAIAGIERTLNSTGTNLPISGEYEKILKKYLSIIAKV